MCADWGLAIGRSASPSAHTHAFVFLIEFGREPAAGEPGADWIRGSNAARTDLRCAELAVVIAGCVRALGWAARGPVGGDAHVDIEQLAQRAGVVLAKDGVLAMPFSQRGFRLGVVTTDYPHDVDPPITSGASLDWPDESAYLGAGGHAAGLLGRRTRTAASAPGPLPDGADQARRPADQTDPAR